eukprot:TRINITY_DN1678_c0_g1_i1.p1 TRINITY_DN1678_c0_g1~~TRINITY_DN1678_c0_g1_i1.p1  ORF type:complete len:296 (+),score=128.34 TRINITY_DN1678_c0_g1_i1:428-1315(+)
MPQEKILAHLKKWLSSRWFAPGRVIEKITLSQVKKCYLPYWWFDVRTESTYTAKVCIINEEVDGAGQKKRIEVWNDVNGVQRDIYNAIILCAASDATDRNYSSTFKILKDWNIKKTIWLDSAPPSFTSRQFGSEATKNENGVSSLDKAIFYSNLMNMNAKKFCGSIAEKIENAIDKWGNCEVPEQPQVEQLLPSYDWNLIWQKQEKLLRKFEKQSAIKSILLTHRGDRVKNFKMDLRYSEFVNRIFYVPIYDCTYLFDNKNYRVLVSGYSGKTNGERPYGAGKIGEWSAALFKGK